MPLSTHYKPLILALLFFCLSLNLNAHQKQDQEQQSNDAISQLYHSLNNNPNSDIATRIERISAHFLGKPYLLGALGEGREGKYDQRPLYRVDAFDCETYVDTVMALAFATNLVQFQSYIKQIRYRNGHVAFIERNHFTCLDWNQNNQRQNFLKDITTTFRDESHQPVCQYAEALIDKPSWYRHFSKEIIHRFAPNPNDNITRLEALKQEGQHLPRTVSILPYIPFSALFDEKRKPNMYLFKQIPKASIVEIVRPNWDLTQEIGTHLNISHLGFVFWRDDIPIFRNATSTGGQVLDIPLIDYLLQALESPTIKGINVQIILPQQNKTEY